MNSEKAVNENKLRIRLEELHQRKLEPALTSENVSLLLSLQEIEDICNFMDSFLYD